MKKTAVFLALATIMSMGAYAVNYNLDVTVSPSDTGYVQLDPTGGQYAEGTNVTLTPIPHPGYIFSHWENDLAGSDSPASIMMNSKKTVTAIFAKEDCALESVRVLVPRNGATIKVGRESSDLPIMFTALSSCTGATSRVTFTLSGGWEFTTASPDQNGLYTVTGPTVANLGYGKHTLYVTAVGASQDTVVKDEITFYLEAESADIDNDSNGLPDNTFSLLNAEGSQWISSVVVPDTMERRITIATRWEGPSEDSAEGNPIVLSVKNPARPAEVITVSAPRSLLNEDESGILIVQIAEDIPTLLGKVESELMGVEPSTLVEGGQYVEVSAIVSLDDGGAYTEVDSGRFDEKLVHITMRGLDISTDDSYQVYSHATGFVANGLYGDRVVAWEDQWGTDSIRRQIVTDAAIDVDVQGLSVFAPYQTPQKGAEISVTPVDGATQDFGFVTLGEYRDATFTVRNVGGSLLEGTATTNNDVFSVISGGSFSLDPGEGVRVTIRFMPTSSGRQIGTAIFSGGGYSTINLRGTGSAVALSCEGAPSNNAKIPAGDAMLLAGALLALISARMIMRRNC